MYFQRAPTLLDTPYDGAQLIEGDGVLRERWIIRIHATKPQRRRYAPIATTGGGFRGQSAIGSRKDKNVASRARQPLAQHYRIDS
jgi:hypothetical protein